MLHVVFIHVQDRITVRLHAPMWALYGYLTQLLGRTIEALQG